MALNRALAETLVSASLCEFRATPDCVLPLDVKERS